MKSVKNHIVNELLDSKDEMKSDLVQFASYAASGDSSAARVFGMRRVRELMKSDPALAHGLRQALTAPHNARRTESQSVTRRANPTWESSQSDVDSGADLLRIDREPRPISAPYYAAEVQAALQSIVREHQSPQSLHQVGLTPTKTVLFSGPPGVGKTLAATWLAHQLKKPLLVLDLGTVMSRYLGATGANLKRAVTYALESDGILFLDELDALAKRRDDIADVGELKRLVTVLLQQLDDWPAGRLLIAATNHPQLLDNAIWRRFEIRVEFLRPGVEELRKIMDEITPRGLKLPPIWREVLPILLAQTSQSEFVRAFSQLRKASILEPAISPADALYRIIKDRLSSMSRQDAKIMALALAKDGTLSLRQISEMTHVSRDTMRRAGIKGV